MFGNPKEFYDEDDEFVTKTSGKKAHHSDGVQRDTDQGKTKFPLMFPEGVPMKDQLIVRIAELYTRGGDTYGDRNWEQSCAPDTLNHHTEALWRHFMKFFFNEQDGEDHAAAIVWNINAVELTRRNIKKAEAQEQLVETPAPSQQLPSPEDIQPPMPNAILMGTEAQLSSAKPSGRHTRQHVTTGSATYESFRRKGIRMALNDLRDKLDVAREYLLTYGASTQEFEAALEHVVWVRNNHPEMDAQVREVLRVVVTRRRDEKHTMSKLKGLLS